MIDETTRFAGWNGVSWQYAVGRVAAEAAACLPEAERREAVELLNEAVLWAESNCPGLASLELPPCGEVVGEIDFLGTAVPLCRRDEHRVLRYQVAAVRFVEAMKITPGDELPMTWKAILRDVGADHSF